MKLFMSKENEDNQRGQGGWGLIQWVTSLPMAGGLELDQLLIPLPSQDSLILENQLVSVVAISHKKPLKYVFVKESNAQYKSWIDKSLKLMIALNNFGEDNGFHKKHYALPWFSLTC